jgi:hypothetical protein
MILEKSVQLFNSVLGADMRRYISMMAAASFLVACQDQGDNSQAASGAAGNGLSLAPGESATFVDGAATSLQPGQWETRLEVLAGPGAGEASSQPPTRSCLVADQAQRPAPNFLIGRNAGEPCTYLHFSMEGDRLYATIECGARGNAIYYIAAGQFAPTSYELRTRAQAPSNGATFDNDLRVTARRIGDCPG